MNRILLSLLVIAVCLVVSCKNDVVKTETKAGFEIYKSDSLGIELQYPQTFQPIANLNQNVPLGFYEIGPDSINYLLLPNILFNFQPIPPVEITFADYMQASRTQLLILMKERNPDFKIFDIDSLNIDGVPVGVFQYETPKDDSTHFTSKMYIAMQKDRAVQINCTAISQNFDLYEGVFDQVLKSIKFKKKAP